MPRTGKTCKVLGCESRSKLHPEKKFYPFAKPWLDLEKSLRWIAATGRDDLPTEYIDKYCYVCSDHFVGGAPSAENPDPLPYEFQASIADAFNRISAQDNSGDISPLNFQVGVNDAEELTAQHNLFEPDAPLSRRAGVTCMDNPLSAINPLSQSHHHKPVSLLKVPAKNGVAEDASGTEIHYGTSTGPVTTTGSQKFGPTSSAASASSVNNKARKRDVYTQTYCRSHVNKLIKTGKLSKLVSTNTRGRNTTDIVDLDDDEEDRPGKRKRWEAAENETDQRCYLSFESISSDGDFEYMCGLSRQHFNEFYEFLGGDKVCSELKYEAESDSPSDRISRFSLKGRLFLTLCRLRRGFTERELAIFFGCSVSVVSCIIDTWIIFIYLEFKPHEGEMLQGVKSEEEDTPQRLKEKGAPQPQRIKTFKGLKVVIECAEIQVETTSSDQQGNRRNTVKYLIGLNVHGSITHVSEACEGSMSDKEVFMQSSLYKMLKPGDIVMADKDFDISHELLKMKVQFVIPSYLVRGDFLNPEDEIRSKKLASPKSFVGNAIERLMMWRILNKTFPQSTVSLVSKMLFVCACLTNFQPQLL